MGFSTLAVFSILFISFLGVSMVVYTVTAENYKEVKEVMEKRSEREFERLNTKINISSITITGNTTRYSLQISMINKGSVTLDVAKLSVLVDGNLTDFVYSPSGVLYPEESVTLYISNLSGAGSHRVKVVCENGVNVYTSYTI